MRLIHGEQAAYYSQRNNAVDSSTACGTTSAINALAALGYAFPPGVGQPEDRLIRFIRADAECLARYRELDPARAYPINQWQEILSIGVSRWFGIDGLARFSPRAKAREILAHIVGGGACLVTGEFPAPNGKVLHHTVAMIGLDMEGEAVSRWFIRDPWGDHRTLYRDVNGALVDLLPEEFVHILKSTGIDSKWCVYINGKK